MSNVNRRIAIYPGRFQPFGRHHLVVYEYLCETFGESNVFIVTSNKTDENSPFTFEEKKAIIEKYGIPTKNVIECVSPYRPIELFEKMDPSKTEAIFVLGNKDYNRLPFTKKDGSPGYFQPFNSEIKESADKHGYVLEMPHITVKHGDDEISGTYLRENLKLADWKQFTDLMGWFDAKLYELITTRLNTLSTIVNESKSIMHLYDDNSLSYYDIFTLLKSALYGKLTGRSEVYEKVDGQNLLATIIDGEVKIAIGDGRELTEDSIKSRYSEKLSLQETFLQAKADLTKVLSKLPESISKKYFDNGKRWVNLEIVHPNTRNVIYYGAQPFLQFHSFVTFEGRTRLMDFNDVKEFVNSLPIIENLVFELRGPHSVIFNVTPEKRVTSAKAANLMDGMMAKIFREYNLSAKATIQDIYDAHWRKLIRQQFPGLEENYQNHLIRRWSYRDKSYRVNGTVLPKWHLKAIKEFDQTRAERESLSIRNRIKLPILLASTYALKNIVNPLCEDITKCRSIVEGELMEFFSVADTLLEHKEMIYEQDEIYTKCGGFTNFMPIEGVVFFHNQKLYKLTGIFSPINQLLGIIKYKR